MRQNDGSEQDKVKHFSCQPVADGRERDAQKYSDRYSRDQQIV